MKKVLLVGLGNLGTRYLQGIIASKIFNHLAITVVEPHDPSYHKAMKTIEPLSLGNQTQLNRSYLASISGVYDIAIIATPSIPRPSIVTELSEKAEIRNWILEKILAASVVDVERIITRLAGVHAWVNTPRRSTALYQKLKIILPNKSLHFSVCMKDFAIGCNAIHFIDTVSWLNNEIVTKIEIETAGGWFDAKRWGYKEFNGYLKAYFSGGSVLEIDNRGHSGKDSISLLQDNTLIEIDENVGFLYGDKRFSGRLEYQSELSGGLVNNILMHQHCSLPTLKESAHQHKMFLAAINDCKELAAGGDGIVRIT